MPDRNKSEIHDRIARTEATIRAAGALALDMFQSPQKLRITEKGLQDQSTDADVAVEALLRDRLAADFADDRFIGEESGTGGGSGRYSWVVDPIDGTQCYLNGIPAWCLSIALLDGSELAGGLIFDPVHDELFSAVRGGGATLNGRVITASSATTVRDGVVGVGFSHRTSPDAATRFIAELAEAGGMFQRNGSGALMLAYVATGRLLGYVEAHINAWDCLAGIALIEEAGGVCNRFLDGDGLTRGGAVMGFAPGVAHELFGISTRAGMSAGRPGDLT